MFGSLGMPELIFILLIALLVFGPKRLPDVGRTLGKGLREFRKATTDLKRTVESEISAVDIEAERPKPAAVPAHKPEPESPSAEEGTPEETPLEGEMAAAAPATAADSPRAD
jgi:TatA/E family protein of Tat protein translocase